MVYLEEVTTDSDGNTSTRPSKTGIPTRARISPLGYKDDSGETQDGGFQTTSRYRLVLVGWQGAPLGAQSQVEWNGKRYSIEGEPLVHNGSRRTAHVTYTLIRR